MNRLINTRVLVVEDNMLVAMDLIAGLEDVGAQVLGPFARVNDALAQLDGQSVDGAILDVNLLDGLVTPLAEYLIERKIPVVFCTGTALPQELKSRHPDLQVCSKPTAPNQLMTRLAGLMHA